ncbi:MAG: DUF4136 domain-containing protein [Polyangiaceae bacterium]
MRFLGFVLLSAMSACAATTPSRVQVQTESVSGGPFQAYRTFGFRLAERPPAPFQVSSRSFEVESRLRSLVAAELVRKGYVEQPDSTKPDFVVRLASGYASELYYTGDPGYDALAANPVEKGAIVIDAFDTSSAAQVWHGTAEAEVDPKRINSRLLETSVQGVLASFPARSSEDRPGVTASQPR